MVQTKFFLQPNDFIFPYSIMVGGSNEHTHHSNLVKCVQLGPFTKHINAATQTGESREKRNYTIEMCGAFSPFSYE